MSQYAGGYSPPRDATTGASTTDVAKDEAAEVARTATQRGGDVAGTVGDQVSRVASETTKQARNLMQEGKGQLAEQAREGQRKAASGLHAVADQLHDMAERSDGTGVVPEMVRQASERTRGVASWLEGREPGDLIDEVRRFARRKPGMFLAGAALAGVLAGRLTRGAVAAQSESSSDDTARANADADTTRLPAAQRPLTPPPAPVPPRLPSQPSASGWETRNEPSPGPVTR